MDFMSEEAARNWCKNAKGSYDLSIEKFVSLVQEYCAKKGPNHHVIFLVDEIGQYIADDTQLMLNLQTIVEDLGTGDYIRITIGTRAQMDALLERLEGLL